MPTAQPYSAFSNAFNSKGRGRDHRGTAMPMAPRMAISPDDVIDPMHSNATRSGRGPSMPYSGGSGVGAPRDRGRNSRMFTGNAYPADVPVMPAAPMSAYQARKAERRQNFQASVDASRETKQIRSATFADLKSRGVDDGTARQRAFVAGAAPRMPAFPGGALPTGDALAGRASEADASRRRANATSRTPGAPPDVYDQARAYQALRGDYGDVMSDDDARRIVGFPTAQGPTTQPSTPNSPSAAPPAPFVSQKGRMAISEQMLKTMFDAAVERSPNRNEAAAEFERTAAQYGVDGRRLLLNWMGEHDGGENPLGYSTEERGGELREVPAAPPAPPAPKRVLTGASGRAGMYETNQGTVMLDANGQKVGPTMAPPAPPAPQQAGRRVELVEGPYRGFRPVPRGPQPGSGASPESVATMNRAMAKASPVSSRAEYDALPQGASYLDARTGLMKVKG